MFALSLVQLTPRSDVPIPPTVNCVQGVGPSGRHTCVRAYWPTRLVVYVFEVFEQCIVNVAVGRKAQVSA